jgi:hypothetical protein
MADNSKIEVVQEFELTDDENDDGFEYANVDEDDLSDDDDSEDFQTALRTLEKSSAAGPGARQGGGGGGDGSSGGGDFKVRNYDPHLA